MTITKDLIPRANPFQVFISSTIDDLIEARTAIDDELSKLEIFKAVRVETLPAHSECSRKICIDEINAADIYILLVNERYGFVPEQNNPDNLSVTHLEYREARRLHRPIFIFIRSDAQPEEMLAKFIVEVSDFEDGHFRKQWQSVSDLQREVRRSLLYWFAAKLRGAQKNQRFEQLLEKSKDSPELKNIPIYTDNRLERNLQKWVKFLIKTSTDELYKNILPIPFISYVESIVDIEGIKIRFKQDTKHKRVDVIIKVDESESVKSKSRALSVTVNVTLNEYGARIVSELLIGIIFYATSDWMHCIDILLDTIAKNSVTDDTSSSVLAACGLISSQHNGQKSSQVVYKMLELKILTVKAVNAGTVALIAARRRADYKQAELSTKQIDGLMVKLLISALHSNENSVEMIYNLGRQFLDAPKAGLFFYNEILKVDPTYDERWYYHRDLGLIYYSINMYEKAAFHYDKSSKLKSNYSELFRFAGDAYYYQGKWYEALIRYEKSTVL